MPLLLKSLLGFYPLLPKAFLKQIGATSPIQHPKPGSLEGNSLPASSPSTSHKSPSPGDFISLVSHLSLSSPCSLPTSWFMFSCSPSPFPKPHPTAARRIFLKCIHCTLDSVSFWLKNPYRLPIAFRIKPKLLSEADTALMTWLTKPQPFLSLNLC